MHVPHPVRLLGLDLGDTTAHRGVVLDREGRVRARRAAVPTVESLGVLEVAALHGAEQGTRLLVVIEPTGPAWLPIAVFFGRRGHLVVRVPSAKAADPRRFLSARRPEVSPLPTVPHRLRGSVRCSRSTG